MQNFIFISPNFPTNYWQFCRELKNDGMNVLGIGDQPYDELKPELKDSLNEYYKVGSLENYDEVYRAVAFFIFKYGRIDWLESNRPNTGWKADAAHGGRSQRRGVPHHLRGLYPDRGYRLPASPDVSYTRAR